MATERRSPGKSRDSIERFTWNQCPPYGQLRETSAVGGTLWVARGRLKKGPGLRTNEVSEESPGLHSLTSHLSHPVVREGCAEGGRRSRAL